MNSNLDDKIDNLDRKIDGFKNKSNLSQERKDSITGERIMAELAAGIIFGVFVGLFLDDHFNTKPLFLISLIILGLAGSFYNIYKSLKNSATDKDQQG